MITSPPCKKMIAPTHNHAVRSVLFLMGNSEGSHSPYLALIRDVYKWDIVECYLFEWLSPKGWIPLQKIRLTKRTQLALKLGIAACAMALVAAPTVTSVASAHSEADGQFVTRTRPGSLELVSSVKVPDAAVQKAVAAARAAYAAELSPFARVTLDQAKKAAMDQFPGATLHDIGLQAMRQNLVYIAMLEKNQARHLVVVDAGNGKVLATRELPDQHHNMRRAMMW